jgi:hypothetical protein
MTAIEPTRVVPEGKKELEERAPVRTVWDGVSRFIQQQVVTW